MNTFLIRSLTGLLFGVVVISCVFFSFHSLVVLLALAQTLAIIEFIRIAKQSGCNPQFIPTLVFSLLIFTAAYLFLIDLIDFRVLAIAILLPVFFPIIELWRNSSTPISNVSQSFFALLYITLPSILLSMAGCPGFVSQNYNPHLIMGFIGLIWINDTFAYLTGVNFGKHKLFERISPKKSWEGFFGGFLLTLAGAALMSLFWKELNLIQWLGVSIIVVIFATLGDLTESMFKRSIQVKDSGSLLPGHGGVLDRFDALFGAAPFYFIYIKLII